jgi:DNA-binding beta-propeller fold protein YncE
MKRITVAVVSFSIVLSAASGTQTQSGQQSSPQAQTAQATQARQGSGLGQVQPGLPPSKAPEQGYVPAGWAPHEGGLLKYRVAIRFGLEAGAAGPSWKPMPEGLVFGRVSAVTTDAQNNVYVLHRGANMDPVVVFDAAGNYVKSWGKGMFTNGHGLRADREGNIWATDNANQQVYKFTPDGKLLQTWGKKGVTGNDESTFGRPTDIAWDSQGNTYIADGYLNGRVVKLDRAGRYVTSWGTRGHGPGQFYVVHSIAIDSRDRIYISDRENNRIQIFDTQGKLLKIWTHLGSTQGIFITPQDELWVLTFRNNVENIMYDTLAGRLMKLDLESGKILGSVESPGHLFTVSRTGDIFVGSLTGNVLRWYPYPQFPTAP